MCYSYHGLSPIEILHADDRDDTDQINESSTCTFYFRRLLEVRKSVGSIEIVSEEIMRSSLK